VGSEGLEAIGDPLKDILGYDVIQDGLRNLIR